MLWAAVHRRRRCGGGTPPPPSVCLVPPPPLDPPPPLPFRCLRLTAKILLRRLRCQEYLRLNIFGPPSAGTIGGPWEEGGPSQTPPSPSPPPPSNTSLAVGFCCAAVQPGRRRTVGRPGGRSPPKGLAAGEGQASALAAVAVSGKKSQFPVGECGGLWRRPSTFGKWDCQRWACRPIFLPFSATTPATALHNQHPVCCAGYPPPQKPHFPPFPPAPPPPPVFPHSFSSTSPIFPGSKAPVR